MSFVTEQALPITGFKGLDKSISVSKEGYTRSLLNVNVEDGQVQGRGGVSFDSTFGTAMSEGISQLMPYTDASTLAVTLLRIGPTKVEKSTNGGSWSDITGTALNGAAGDKPQWADFRNTLYFTNEGKDLPRKWAGSGNTAVIASSTSPKAKAIMSYYGRLFLLNIDDAAGGSFLPRRAMYSETPDTDWSTCDGNILNFNETPGAVLTGIPYGEFAGIMKEDGVVSLRWTGGGVRFNQRLVRGAPGTLAPLAAQPLGNVGVIYLGTDYKLWIVNDSGATPLPPNVNDILKDDLYKTDVANCRSVLLPTRQLYSLFIPIDSSGNTARINVNYRTQEFTYSTYPSHPIAAAWNGRWTKTAAESLIGAVSTKTYTFDTADKVDEITASTERSVTRRYDTDWIRLAQGALSFTGATLVFEANAHTKCAVSTAIDHKNSFKYRKVYDLRPKNPSDEYIAVRYDLPPTPAEWVNLRIEFLPSTTVNPTLRSGAIHFLTTEKRDVRRSASLSEG